MGYDIINYHERVRQILTAIDEGLKDAGGDLDRDWHLLCEPNIQNQIGGIIANALVFIDETDDMKGMMPLITDVEDWMQELTVWYEDDFKTHRGHKKITEETREDFLTLLQERLSAYRQRSGFLSYRLAKFRRLLNVPQFLKVARRQQWILADTIDLAIFSAMANTHHRILNVNYIYALGRVDDGRSPHFSSGNDGGAYAGISSHEKRISTLFFEKPYNGIFEGRQRNNPTESAVLLRSE